VRLRREVVTEDREITRELKRERAEVDHPTQETSSR
jgi:stress response protein YsnF